MNIKWDDTSCQKEFLNMKVHLPSGVKSLVKSSKGLWDAWPIGVPHVKYEKLKKRQEEQQQR